MTTGVPRLAPRVDGAEPSIELHVLSTRRPLVHLAAAFPARSRLADRFELAPTPEGAAGVVAFRTTRVDAAYLDRAGPDLRIVVSFGAGYDNIDIDAARERNVRVATIPDITTGTVAEHTLGLMIDVMRQISRGDRLIRGRDPRAFEPGVLLGRGLFGATVGIVGGNGRIGSEVARLVTACGAKVTLVGRGELDRAVGTVDVLSLHCPLNDATRHLVNERVLNRMGRGSYLVNVARGAVVDEAALVTALEEGMIAGAALDVFEYEPNVTKALLQLDNVVLTPHLGAATYEARLAKASFACSILEQALLDGRIPASCVC